MNRDHTFFFPGLRTRFTLFPHFLLHFALGWDYNFQEFHVPSDTQLGPLPWHSPPKFLLVPSWAGSREARFKAPFFPTLRLSQGGRKPRCFGGTGAAAARNL